MAKAIVLGAGGQLGVEIMGELTRRGHEAHGFTRSQLDITDQPSIRHAIKLHRPDWVFNCAAYNQVDRAESEPEVAMRVNGLAVRGIAECCREGDSALAHYSTDHVFDGAEEEPYTEKDPPHPLSAYAISKLAGELYAKTYLDRLCVIRVAGVFGPAGRRTSHGNFPELILRKAAEKAPLRIVEDFFATPTYTLPLAERSLDLLERGVYGLYHMGGGTELSWYHYALKVAEAAHLEADIQPTNHLEFKTAARRPPHAGLSNAKMEALGLAPMPPLEDALADYLERRLGETNSGPDSGGIDG